ncbi:MAG: thiolase family protein [Planctomycetota bacterium]
MTPPATARDDETPVIVGCRRTAIGLGDPGRGVFRRVRGDELAAAAIAAAVAAAAVDPATIEDVILGCTQPRGELGGNVARNAALLAGLPFGAAGATVDRGGGSGLEALVRGAQAIRVGAERVVVAGGVDHPGRGTAAHGADIHPRALAASSRGVLAPGLCAEHLAIHAGIDRRRQEAWALESHRRAAAADWKDEIVAVGGHDEGGRPATVVRDEAILAAERVADLDRLEPLFLPGAGTITAATAAPPGAGAAALVIMSRGEALRRRLTPLATVVATATVGIPPAATARGALHATRKLLGKSGVRPEDIDHFELDETFAAEVINDVAELGIDPALVNPCGGSLALGNPPGAAGARMATTLVHALVRSGGRWGLAATSIGLGQGLAVLFEQAGS